MSRFLHEKYRSLAPYTPGEQPKNSQLIKLNTNESPFPPSQKVIEALSGEEAEKLRLYPDPEAGALVDALAKNLGVPGSRIIVGNGSDELLAFSFMAFQGAQGKIHFPDISYGFYPVYANLFGAKGMPVPLAENLSLRARDYFGLSGTIVIANPNAPTGSCLSVSEIEAILKANPDNLVLIDEAYVDFGAESCVSLVERYDNLLVMRTFSKSRNLAGARIGFAVAGEEIIADLARIKYSFNPYNLNRLSILAGAASLADEPYFRSCMEKIKTIREEFVWEMKKTGFEILPSQANFVFMRHDRIGGAEYYTALREKNILVRHFDQNRIRDYVRITIGRSKDMEKLVWTSRELLSGGGRR